MRVMVRAMYSRQQGSHKGERPQLLRAEYAEVPDGVVKRAYVEQLCASLPAEAQEDCRRAVELMARDGYFD